MALDDYSDIRALIDYINETKPFHTKLTDVTVEYTYNETLNAVITDDKHINTRLAGIWCVEEYSNGVTRQYRIPGISVPRFSQTDNLITKVGVTDEDPGSAGSYRLPYNNGVIIHVDGVLQVEGTDYVVTYPVGNIVQFTPGNHPALNAEVQFNYITLDRILIAIDGVGQEYQYEGYDPVLEKFDPYVNDYDEGSYDSTGWELFSYDELTGQRHINTEIAVEPIGRIRVLQDDEGYDYYVFEFTVAPENGALIQICVEQQESHNNRADTRITEEILFTEMLSFSEDIGVVVVENQADSYDEVPYDTLGYDVSNVLVTIDSAQPGEPGNSEDTNVGIVDSESLVQGSDIGWPVWQPWDNTFVGTNITLSGSDFIASKAIGGGTNDSTRSAISMGTGLRHYWETVIDTDLNGVSVGIISTTSSFTSSDQLGDIAGTVALRSNGDVYIDGTLLYNIGTTFSDGDIVSHSLDLVAGEYYVSINGGNWQAVSITLTGDYYAGMTIVNLEQVTLVSDEHNLTYTPRPPQPQGWRFGIFVNVP